VAIDATVTAKVDRRVHEALREAARKSDRTISGQLRRILRERFPPDEHIRNDRGRDSNG